jgi:two-component system, cell cycle response regulator DivK
VVTDVKQATVIVVEDNADNLFIVSDMLREDVGVKYCNGRASGRQFFKLLESNPHLNIDLILLDIQIPGEDGYEVLRQIRAMRHLRHITVVALTANVMPQDVQRARESGFDGFIGKPINGDRFPQQILRILAGEVVWEPR